MSGHSQVAAPSESHRDLLFENSGLNQSPHPVSALATSTQRCMRQRPFTYCYLMRPPFYASLPEQVLRTGDTHNGARGFISMYDSVERLRWLVSFVESMNGCPLSLVGNHGHIGGYCLSSLYLPWVTRHAVEYSTLTDENSPSRPQTHLTSRMS